MLANVSSALNCAKKCIILHELHYIEQSWLLSPSLKNFELLKKGGGGEIGTKNKMAPLLNLNSGAEFLAIPTGIGPAERNFFAN